jgi:hypothetical protein
MNGASWMPCICWKVSDALTNSLAFADLFRILEGVGHDLGEQVLPGHQAPRHSGL